MPDVSRSDSQRSDASHKPRVSFNRDVHVKRIGREGVVSALAGDGEGHLVPLPVRRERPVRRSRRELEQEAEAILRQAERVQCTPSMYNTLPPRPRHSGHPPAASIFNSLERSKSRKKKPLEGSESVRLKRRFSNPDNSWKANSSPERSSPDVPQRKLNRSVSDAGHREVKKESSIFGTLDRIRKKKKKPPSFSGTPVRTEVVAPVRKKKQLSPIIEMSPKVEADPFRFAPTDVVYAEVVARPSGKTTVHTAVPVAQPQPQPQPGSEEDEGVDMGHRGGTQSRRFSYENDILRSASPKEYTVDVKREMDVSKRRDNDIHGDKIINMLRSRSNPLLDEDLVGGYRREVRTERVIRVEGGDEPDGRGRADGMDFSSKRRLSKDFVEEEMPLKSSYFEGKMHSYDDLDRIKYQEPIRAWTPPLETSLIDSNNLSYRRDRLESRLTNHKRRFLSTAQERQESKSYPREKSEDLRKDFLISQINEDKDKGYFEKKIATEIDTHRRQQLMKNKDVFADSGIEMSDYRKDSAKDEAMLNRKNIETTRITRTETSRTRSTPVLNKSDYPSDAERRYKGDISLKFIEEERRRREAIPASSTLVKNYSKPSKEDHKSTIRKEEKTKEKKKEKLTRMDKVKQLMFGSRDAKKNKKKQPEEEEEDLLRRRYTEYKGSDVSVNSSPAVHRRRQTSSSEVDDRTDQELEFYGSRQRLATPTPSPSDQRSTAEESWFKSLTRRNKTNKADLKHKPGNGISENGSKHLRFFGDSDRESNGRHRRESSPNPHLLQVPSQPRPSRRAVVDSSAESTTEGDGSQHSQRSVVYLHAATVGDIPGSKKLHRSVISGSRRSMSREELSSTAADSSLVTPQARTLSRSVSVLAPWRPRHNRQEVVYDSGGKPPKPPKLRRPEESKKLEHKDKHEKHKKSSRDLRKSKENLIDYREDSRRGSSDSIFNEKRSRGNLVFVGKRESYDESDRSNENGNGTVVSRTHHTIDRTHRSRTTDKPRDLSRSISIPKDARVSSGWFKGKTAKAK